MQKERGERTLQNTTPFKGTKMIGNAQKLTLLFQEARKNKNEASLSAS